MSKENEMTAKDLHRQAALERNQSVETAEDEYDDDDDEFDEGFDLSILMKHKKRDSRNASVLGASFSSNLSVLTEDDLFDFDDSISNWRDREWDLDDEDQEENRAQYDETIELIDRTMMDLKEISLEEKSPQDRLAIGNAIDNIKSSMEKGERIDSIGEDLDTIRNHLFSDGDENDNMVNKDRAFERENDSKTMMWETILCRVRAGTALSVYGIAAANWQDMSNMIVFVTKFVGVAVLCFLAGVPRRDETEATPNGFKIQLVFFSRKTVLLLIYIVAWISVFDASMEAWTEHQRLRSMGSKIIPISQENGSVRRAELRNVSLEREPETDPIDIVAILAEGKRKVVTPEVLSEGDTSGKDIEPIDIIATLRGTVSKDVENQAEDKMEPMKERVDKPKEKLREKVDKPKDNVTKRKETPKRSQSLALVGPGRLRGGVITPQKKQDILGVPDALRMSLRGETFPSRSAIVEVHSSQKNLRASHTKKFLEQLGRLVQSALKHCVLFFLGSHEGDHKSQHMLDMLGEIWTSRRWH